MTKQQIVPIVNQFISDNKYQEAFDVLATYLKDQDRYLENDLLMQRASYNRNYRDLQTNLLTQQEFDGSLARLIRAIQYILDRLPNTGNPVEQQMLNPSATPQEDPKVNKVKKILFLTANPKNPDGPALRTESEMQAVKSELRMASGRDLFDIEFEPAVKIPDITRSMIQHKPEIIHFSGHGHTTGIIVEGVKGEIILFPTEGLNRLFKLTKGHVKCVVLNACYSKAQAKVISEHNIHVIGMSDEIGDETAREFAVGFYQSLGNGDTVDFAYEIAMINISHKTQFANLPELWFNGEKISS